MKQKDLRQATADQDRRLAQARATLTRLEGQAEAVLNRASSRAGELRQQIEAEIAQTQAQINALQSNGVEAVMRQLARRLDGIRIQIQPFRQDGSPETIRLEGTPVGGVQ